MAVSLECELRQRIQQTEQRDSPDKVITTALHECPGVQQIEGVQNAACVASIGRAIDRINSVSERYTDIERDAVLMVIINDHSIFLEGLRAKDSELTGMRTFSIACGRLSDMLTSSQSPRQRLHPTNRNDRS